MVVGNTLQPSKKEVDKVFRPILFKEKSVYELILMKNRHEELTDIPIEFINDIGIDNIHEHEMELHKYALEKLEKLDNVIIYNKNADSGIITFNIKGVFAQDAATYLNSKGICVRSGQHCAKILMDFLNTHATLRASFYLHTTKEEIDALAEACKTGGDFLDAYFA